MSLDWENEKYVRLYTRDTADWLALSFDAQALIGLVMRKLDRAGVLHLGRQGKRGVAIAIGHATEWPRLEPALDELLADGTFEIIGEQLLMPNFRAGQEARASAAQRKREQRERELFLPIDPSRDVTGSHSEPSLAKPSSAKDKQNIPGSSTQGEPERSKDAAPGSEPGFDFEAVYALYPRKLGRKKGMQRCRSQITTREKYDALLRAVKNYAAIKAGTEMQFLRQFDTFMSSWEDWIDQSPDLERRTKGNKSSRQMGFSG